MKKEKPWLKNNTWPDSGRSARYFIALFLFFLFALNLTSVSASQDSSAEKDAIKNKIDALRSQIDAHQKEIFEKRQKEATLSDEISILETDIRKIELQIQETELSLQNLDIEVNDKQAEIEGMETKIDAKKEILTKFLEQLYEQGRVTSAELIFGNRSLSQYLFRTESLETFENQTKEVFDQLLILRKELKNQKEILLEKRDEQENLRSMQADQRGSLESDKAIKDFLMSRTRNEEEALSRGLEKLREQLNALQSLGSPIVIGDAIKSAQYAASMTNVSPEFLLGVLRVESGLGTNVGGGRYSTDMNPNEWDTFKKICKELKLDPDKMPVSRRVCYNRDSKDGCGGWGGAMGPAQFMPSTWTGYKSKVEKTSGVATANPWDLNDALVAMGLKLSAVDGVTDGDRKAEAKAAGMYLAGANWEKYSWYSDRVLFYADAFKKIIKSGNY